MYRPLAVCIILALPATITCFHHLIHTKIRYAPNKSKPSNFNNVLISDGRTSPSFKLLKPPSMHSISLDTAVLSGGKFGGQRNCFCVLLIALIATRFLKSLSGESETSSIKSPQPKATSSTPAQNVIESLIRKFTSITGALGATIQSSIAGLKDAATSMLGVKKLAEDVKLDDWNVCKLQQREALFGGRYTRYRFDLENSSSKMPLYIGQEIIMCSTDTKGRVLKENFFPITASAVQGYFEVLVKRNTGGGAYDKFVRSLDSLAEGDEIAFKGGAYRLNYEGADDPIKYVTVVSTGVGIAPSLQILNGILSDKESTVEDTELLWMNSDSKDFVCDKDVVALEKKYEKKLFVTRVNENKLFEQDFTQTDAILGALSAYEAGRIAVVCGTDDVILKVKDLLLNVGYPSYSVVTIST